MLPTPEQRKWILETEQKRVAAFAVREARELYETLPDKIAIAIKQGRTSEVAWLDKVNGDKSSIEVEAIGMELARMVESQGYTAKLRSVSATFPASLLISWEAP